MTRESIMTKEARSSASAKLAILPMWVIDRIKEEMRLGPAAWQAITDAVEQADMPQALPCEVKLPPGTVIDQGTAVSTLMLAIQQRASQPPHAQVFTSAEPEHSHPDPIAWMVGTAFWWTKEEAERDAAATGLPIVGLGPMTATAPAEQDPGEPVAWRGINDLGEVVTEWIDGAPPESMVDLCGNPASYAKIEQAYTHADPGEVERQKSRADINALRHRHAKNAIGDILAYVKRMVAGSSGQQSVATGYLGDIVDFIQKRTSGDPVEQTDINDLRMELQEARRRSFNSEVAYKAAIERQEELRTEVERLRAHLAEAQALLRRAINGGDDGLGLDIDTFLSASAEPVSPRSEPEKPSRCTSCDNCQGFNTGHDSSQQMPYSVRCDNCNKEARSVDHVGLAKAWNAANQSE